MAPAKKSKGVRKRFLGVNEESPEKNGGNGGKAKQRKRKLSDMLGSQWSSEELVRFYEAYRKYGKDWKKVSAAVHNRSVEMVEALYNMNTRYLSLPEGVATVVGLIAMMTDHYDVLEGSDSDQENNDASVISHKPQKHAQGKFRLNVSKKDRKSSDSLPSQSMSTSYGCLSLLKEKHSDGGQPRAVGKRTPRFPVSYTNNRDDTEKFLPPNRQGLRSHVDANDDDDVAYEIALALAKASQRGSSPQVSQRQNRRTEHLRPPSEKNAELMHAKSKRAITELVGTAADDDFLDGNTGSREAENEEFDRDSNSLIDAEGARVEVHWEGKKYPRKKLEVEDIFYDVKEACFGTEGLNLSNIDGKVENEITNAKSERLSFQGPRKKSRQLFSGDESSSLDALQTLAEVSLMLPPSKIEPESPVQFKDVRRTLDMVDKPRASESMSANQKREKTKATAAGKTGHQSTTGVEITPQESSHLRRDSGFKVNSLSEAKQPVFQSTPKKGKGKWKSLASKALAGEGKKSIGKAMYSNKIASPHKQENAVRPEGPSCATETQKTGVDSAASCGQGGVAVDPVNIPTKVRSSRKMWKVLKSSESIGNNYPNNKNAPILLDNALDLKDILSHCLSSDLLRQWCAYEWFYSAIDYPWFAKREFVEYLNHVRLGDISRLTRSEWGVIKSSLGKPRRLSQQFLREEKEKLEQYRESVRTHYAELQAGVREGLPTDLALPLSVGQHVVAYHPRTREIHSGSVLTVDQNRCRVQFDQPELGVDFIKDIDCMPANPLENMPVALQRQRNTPDKFRENFNKHKLSQSSESKEGSYVKYSSSKLEILNDRASISSSSYPTNSLLEQAKVPTASGISQAEAAASETVDVQEATYSQPRTLAQVQAREADIQALYELTDALDKKEALVLELRHMNDKVEGNQKHVEDFIKELEPFKKQYAMLLRQLTEANNQVFSALLYLRQRNTYPRNPKSPLMKPVSNSVSPGGPPGYLDYSGFLFLESGSPVAEIVERSTLKAKTLVDAVVQEMSSFKEGKDAFPRVGKALDSANNLHSGADSGIPTTRSLTYPDEANESSWDLSTSCTSNPVRVVHPSVPKSNHDSEFSEARVPAELISSCIATLLVIQRCMERQYPRAEVARILDSAVTCLKPCCSQNLYVYGEIQECMGIVKDQISALTPT